MCRVLEVSRGGYYKWQKRRKSRRETENDKLLIEIRVEYKKGRKTYGSPTITDEINKKSDRKINRKRVARIMRENGIRAKTKRKFKITTHSSHKYPISPNLLKQNFVTTALNKVWLSDITYIRTMEGWLYLATIMDLYSRKIVGWAMSERLTRQLVMDAFEHAVGRRGHVNGLIFHSDRGSQYASYDFRDLLTKHYCISSMSGTGNCYDNAVAESFFSTLKRELIFDMTYETRREAISSIFEYIEVFYNRIRRHTSIGGLSPETFEALLLQKAA
jgi:transposase InsO family protein